MFYRLHQALLEELEEEDEEQIMAQIPSTQQVKYAGRDRPVITDKEFYKAMQKLKDRGSNAVPPKKSASAYIIFGKEVPHSFYSKPMFNIETTGDPEEESHG